MAELVLHVGTKKTGTSFLQRYLSSNLAVLRASGWMYPEFLRNENHLSLALPFEEKVTNEHRQRSLFDASSRARSADRWARQLREHVKPGQKWIITSEHFSSRLQRPEEVQDAVDFLHKFFDDITVVMFFRRQEFVYPSSYSQSIKAGDVLPWGWEYCEKHLNEYDYDSMYGRWSGSVGVEKVHALPYFESYKRDTGEFLSKFGSASGIDFGPKWVVPKESKANRSLSAEGVVFLRAINPYVPRLKADDSSNNRRRQIVIERVMELTEGPSFHPGPEFIDRLTQCYLNSNASMVSRMPDSHSWQAWLDQPVGQSNSDSGEAQMSASRVAELMVALSEPIGPVAWGQPDGRPLRLRQLASERLAARRRSKVNS